VKKQPIAISPKSAPARFPPMQRSHFVLQHTKLGLQQQPWLSNELRVAAPPIGTFRPMKQPDFSGGARMCKKKSTNPTKHWVLFLYFHTTNSYYLFKLTVYHSPFELFDVLSLHFCRPMILINSHLCI
jgi:hypothetical protein